MVITILIPAMLCGCSSKSTTTLPPAQNEAPSPTSSGKITEPTPPPIPTPGPIVNRTTHGRIRWDETWKGEIHIVGDIIVEQGYTLTIEPGTKVLVAANSDVENLNTDPFNMQIGIRQEQAGEDPFYRGVHFGEPYRDEGNHISILILGTLHAVGTPEQMITITSDSSNPGTYDWNHFNFSNGILSYCTVEYYRCLGPSDDTEVSYNTLRHAGETCVVAYSSVVIEHNTMSYAGHEVIGTQDYCPTIRFNHIGPNPEHVGIHVEGSSQIIGNTIMECRHGIDLFGGSPHIAENTIRDCKRGIALFVQSGVLDEDNMLKGNLFSNNDQDIAFLRLQP
ncbi:MAG: right-handed parallel beta-helix repeat-containing protein [Chloroflexota bacterium]